MGWDTWSEYRAPRQGEETATMADGVRTQKRRLEVPRRVARYGDAVGRRRGAGEVGLRATGGFSFSSPGLALLGLRRPDRRAGAK